MASQMSCRLVGRRTSFVLVLLVQLAGMQMGCCIGEQSVTSSC
jgi:hypothetical protein